MATIVGPQDGKAGSLGSIGVRFLLWTQEAGGQWRDVDPPMPPRPHSGPLHRHSREDEYSYVLEGRMGAQLGDEVVYAEAGDFVFKPRDEWHTFWNAGDEPCRILEVISPAGFERFFRELSDMGGVAEVDEEAFERLRERYGLEMRAETVPELVERFGVRMGEPLSGGWVPRVG